MKQKIMSLREVNFWYWLVRRLPRKLIYFCIMWTWAEATTKKFTDRHPDEVLWSDAVKFLGVE